MKIAKIKENKDIVRDLDSNAIIFHQPDTSVDKKRQFFNKQAEDINNLKNEVSELKQTMNKILEMLTKDQNR